MGMHGPEGPVGKQFYFNTHYIENSTTKKSFTIFDAKIHGGVKSVPKKSSVIFCYKFEFKNVAISINFKRIEFLFVYFITINFKYLFVSKIE